MVVDEGWEELRPTTRPDASRRAAQQIVAPKLQGQRSTKRHVILPSVGETERKAAREFFDAALPDYAGMIDAELTD